MPAHTPKLLDQVRQALRRKHYSLRTEEAYVAWIKRSILFHHKRHPQELGVPEVEAFFTLRPERAVVHVKLDPATSLSARKTNNSPAPPAHSR